MSLMDEKRTRFYDEWEEMPADKRLPLIRERLSAYVAYARQSGFYRDRLEGFDPRSTYPLKNVPVLDPKEFRSQIPPQGNGVAIGNANDCSVFQSGGTTGIPKTSLFTHDELEGLTHPNARGFYALGLRQEDRVANLWASGSLYMTFTHINRMLQQYGCMNFPFANHTDPKFIHSVIRHFKINVLTGVASYVLHNVRAFESLGMDDIRIQKIYYGAEHFFEADKQEIRNKTGAEIIAAPGYGTVDTWYLGYQCLNCESGVFHVHDDEAYLEIVDENTAEPCADGEPGMLYVTVYPRRLTPVIRYRVGDRAEWIGKKCACGRETPLFRLLGRGDDILRIGCDSVDYAAVQDCVMKVKGLSGTVQMEKTRSEGKDRLTIQIETECPATEHARLCEALDREIKGSRQMLREQISQGNIWPLEIRCCPTGTLPRNPKTGKLIRVIDKVE